MINSRLVREYFPLYTFDGLRTRFTDTRQHIKETTAWILPDTQSSLLGVALAWDLASRRRLWLKGLK